MLARPPPPPASDLLLLLFLLLILLAVFWLWLKGEAEVLFPAPGFIGGYVSREQDDGFSGKGGHVVPAGDLNRGLQS